MPENDIQSHIEKEAALFAKSQEQNELVENQESPLDTIQPTALGKAKKFQDREDDSLLASEIGWKNIPMDSLPTGGHFYPEGTQIAIRSASVSEIRHWSTIDQNDLLSMDDMLNFIIEKCCRIKIPNRSTTHRNLVELDRFYLIFAIRDLTFKNGENKLVITVSDDNGVEEKIEVTKDSLDYFNPDERLQKYYDSSERCFKIQMKNGESFNIYLPTLGIMNFIKNFIKKKQNENKNFDRTFIKYAPFVFPDWNILTQAVYEREAQNSLEWSLQKISVIDKLVEILSSSINPQVRYVSSNGGERVAPLDFQGGIKSIFLISDIFGELV